MSWDHLRWRNGDVEHVLPVVPIYGLTDRLEVSAEIPYLIHQPADNKDHEGIGDITLVGKFPRAEPHAV